MRGRRLFNECAAYELLGFGIWRDEVGMRELDYLGMHYAE